MDKLLVIVGIIILLSTEALGQTIAGTVTDASTGDTLPGVNVVIKGTTTGTSTDQEGVFELNVPSLEDTLVISFIGYQQQEIPIAGRTDLVISLASRVVTGDELVVIGYGTTEKKNLTGAVSVVKMDNVENRSSSDVAGALTGLVSGVKVTSSGRAGTNSAITIRGIGNLTNNNPLFIVDGTPIGGGINALNMHDIESIQVLKDASAAAIYGSRAANGVVLITTKSGQSGPAKAEFTTDISTSWLPRHDLLGREEYIKYVNMAYENAIEMGIVGAQPEHFGANTNWQDAVLERGLKQNYNLSVSGGSESSSYFLSLNKLNNSGTTYGTSYDRWSFRVNTSSQQGAFTFGENINIIASEIEEMEANPFQHMVRMAPTIPVYDENQPGGFGVGDVHRTNFTNPVARQELHVIENGQTSIKGNIFGEVNFVENFSGKLNFSYAGYFNEGQILRKQGIWTIGQDPDADFLTRSRNENQTILVENTYNYINNIGRHDLEVLGGVSYQQNVGEDVWGTRQDPLRNMQGDYYTTLGSATGDARTGGAYGESVLLSYFGRVNYTYDDKYVLTLTFRRDGTSRLPKQNRWGTFPSIAGAWKINEEDFFEVPFISQLKLRANYGILGNSEIGNWDYLANINTNPRAILGEPEDLKLGATQSQLVNDNLTWEKQKQANIGVDAAFLDNRLQLTAEYFNSTTEDVLVALPILGTSGNAGGNPVVNAASLENKGIELDLSWSDHIDDFSYGASINYTRLRNKALDLGYGQVEYFTNLAVSRLGAPLANFYLLEMEGIFRSQQEIDNHTNDEGVVIQPNAQPGDVKYNDYNGDGSISSADRHVVGSPWPDYEIGLTLNASWKNFNFLLHGFGRFGHEIWNGARNSARDFNNGYNNFADIDPWAEQNADAKDPRVIFGDLRNSRHDQDRWLEDGTFFRINKITLGYSIPNDITSEIGISNTRFACTLTNLVTFTNYSGLDPNFYDNGIFEQGADHNAYPNARSVTFSLSLSL